MSAPAATLTTRALGPDDWPAIEALFGPRGACGGCWCMSWRVPAHGKAWEAAKGEGNRAAFRALVEAGEAHGVLAFSEGAPVGWCSYGPRASFPKLLGSRALQREAGEGTWSVVCFFIPARWRHRGVAGALLRAACEQAFAAGATELEGFPAAPPATGKELAAAFAWTGVPRLFESAGFERLARPPGARPIYVKRA